MKRILSLLLSAVLLFAALSPLLPAAFATGNAAGGSRLSTDKTEYREGEPIMVTATGSGKDWVGIVLKGEQPEDGGTDSIRWYYVVEESNPKDIRTAGLNNSRADLADLPAGEYTIFLLENDGYAVIASVDIKVTPAGGAAGGSTGGSTGGATGNGLATDKSVYREGEEIYVTATGAGSDWVGIYRQGETPAAGGIQSIVWYYVAKDGNLSGEAKALSEAEYVNRADLADLPAGDYTIFLLANDGYAVIAQVNITIEEDPALHPAPAAPASASYKRSSTVVGLADGVLTVVAGEADLPDAYRAYWGNASGPLADYTALAPIACTGVETSAELAAHTLIPKEADRLLVYAVRGRKASETPAVVMLPAGCNDYDFGAPLYELQVLSDIHLRDADSDLHNRHFAMALADIQKLSPASIGIFINGDIADHGALNEYLAFERILKNAGALPGVYCAIGNHDLADGPYSRQLSLFLAHTDPGVDSVYYDFWQNGAHFIFLGSEAPGLAATLSNKQLTWFREKLAENRDPSRPIYVFLHQGLMDTVAGTFEYQGWHGIKQSAAFASILKDYPEVVLFTGHSHWEMDSYMTMKPADDALPTIFNTAACAYLWNDASMATDQGLEGSQGYYLYVYDGRLVVRGRDFVTGQWIASAQFIADLPQAEAPGGNPGSNPGSNPGDNPGTTPSETTTPAGSESAPETSAPMTSGEGAPATTAPVPSETPVTSDSATGDKTDDSSSSFELPPAAVVGIAAACAVLVSLVIVLIAKKKKKK